jgi:competence protein ComEA
MPRRHPVEDLSPRALARLRSRPGAYVPTASDLAADPHEAAPTAAPPADAGSGRSDAGRHARAVRPRGWVRLPAAFVGARWEPRRAAVLGVVVVGLLTVAVFGLRVLWASADAQGTVIAPGGGSRAGPTGLSAASAPVGVAETAGQGFGPTSSPSPSPAGSGGPPAGAATSAVAPASGVVVVHVVGQVKRPGVQELPSGSRVAQAVEAAGGASKGADLSRVNLARVLVDGEQVRVPAPGDPVDPLELTGPGPPAGGTGGAGSAGGAGGLVPLNSADLAALDTLPGVGPVLAQRILDWRTEHGRFTSVDELGEVSGIGEKLLAQLSPLVTL